MILTDVSSEILKTAAQISPAVVIGVWALGELIALIKNWPERQDRKVIRDSLRMSLASLTTDVSVVAHDIQILSVRLEPLPRELGKINEKLDQIMNLVRGG